MTIVLVVPQKMRPIGSGLYNSFEHGTWDCRLAGIVSIGDGFVTIESHSGLAHQPTNEDVLFSGPLRPQG